MTCCLIQYSSLYKRMDVAPNGNLKSDISCKGKPHILKSLAFSFIYVIYLFFSLLLRLTELQKLGRQAKMQSTSKITLARHSKTHAIKTSNTALIIMFPIVPFHQGFQSQMYHSAVMLWTTLTLMAASLPPFPLLTCAPNSNWIWWTIILPPNL